MVETQRVRRLYRALAVASVVACLAMTGCAKPAGTPRESNSAATKSDETVPKKYSQSELATMLVAELKNQCNGLAEFAVDPANWQFTYAETGESPFEMGISGGDGGDVVLLVTPDGSNRVRLAISPDWAESTNMILWNSGCTSLAAQPQQDSGTSDDQGNGAATNVNTFELPDFVGYTQNDVTNWFRSNGLRVQPFFRYGFNPKVSCEVSGDGMVTAQNPRAGATVEDTPSSRVEFDVNCDW